MSVFRVIIVVKIIYEGCSNPRKIKLVINIGVIKDVRVTGPLLIG